MLHNTFFMKFIFSVFFYFYLKIGYLSVLHNIRVFLCRTGYLDWVTQPYSKQQKYQLNKKVGEHLFFQNIQIIQISGIVPL